jgi:hypothetical protein
VLQPVCCNTTTEEVLAALEDISTAITGATPARNELRGKRVTRMQDCRKAKSQNNLE